MVAVGDDRASNSDPVPNEPRQNNPGGHQNGNIKIWYVQLEIFTGANFCEVAFQSFKRLISYIHTCTHEIFMVHIFTETGLFMKITNFAPCETFCYTVTHSTYYIPQFLGLSVYNAIMASLVVVVTLLAGCTLTVCVLCIWSVCTLICLYIYLYVYRPEMFRWW